MIIMIILMLVKFSKFQNVLEELLAFEEQSHGHSEICCQPQNNVSPVSWNHNYTVKMNLLERDHHSLLMSFEVLH